MELIAAGSALDAADWLPPASWLNGWRLSKSAAFFHRSSIQESATRHSFSSACLLEPDACCSLGVLVFCSQVHFSVPGISEQQLHREKARGSSSINTFQSYDLVELIKTWWDDSSSRNINISGGICSEQVDREKDVGISLYVNVHIGISCSEVNNKEAQKLSHNFWVQFEGQKVLVPWWGSIVGQLARKSHDELFVSRFIQTPAFSATSIDSKNLHIRRNALRQLANFWEVLVEIFYVEAGKCKERWHFPNMIL